jgi:peroxiredoxin
MDQTRHLFEKLRRCEEDAPEWKELYDGFVDRLTVLEMGKSAPSTGMPFPALSLPDSRGHYRDISDYFAQGPLVISFNRGGWCPYCRHELESWRDALPMLAAAGGSLVVIAGEVGGRGAALESLLGGAADVLCDVDHGAALGLGLAFHAGTELLRRYLECGLDLSDIYGEQSGILPIPATFVVDAGGIVRYAFVEPDFRLRAEPLDVIKIVESLGK